MRPIPRILPLALAATLALPVLALAQSATDAAEPPLGRGATVELPVDDAFEAQIAAIPVVPNADLADPSAMNVDVDAFDTVFNHHYTPAGDLRIHHVSGGEGPPVLLLHGWPTTWYEWYRVMPLLAEDYRVIVPDLPGIGRSQAPLTAGVKRDIAQTMLDLMTELGHEEFLLVGHDWGTPTAFAMAYLAPERIERLVLTESTIPGLDVPGVADWDTFNGMWWHHNFHAQAGTPELLVTGREREYLDSKYRAWTWNYEETFTQDYLDEFADAYTQPGVLSNGFALYRALGVDAEHNRAFLDDQGRLPMPTMVVTGRYQVGEGLHRQIIPVAEDYTGVMIDRAQHFLMIEAPATLTGLLTAFFEDQPLPGMDQ